MVLANTYFEGSPAYFIQYLKYTEKNKFLFVYLFAPMSILSFQLCKDKENKLTFWLTYFIQFFLIFLLTFPKCFSSETLSLQWLQLQIFPSVLIPSVSFRVFS